MNPGDFENVMMSSRPSFTIELGLTNHLNFTIKTLKKDYRQSIYDVRGEFALV